MWWDARASAGLRWGTATVLWETWDPDPFARSSRLRRQQVVLDLGSRSEESSFEGTSLDPRRSVGSKVIFIGANNCDGSLSRTSTAQNRGSLKGLLQFRTRLVREFESSQELEFHLCQELYT